MEMSQFRIHPTMMQGPNMVANRDLVLGQVTTNLEGAGIVDMFVPGKESLKSAFEQPVEIRDGQGNLLKTLRPFSKEALEHLCRGGLSGQGVAVERQP